MDAKKKGQKTQKKKHDYKKTWSLNISNMKYTTGLMIAASASMAVAEQCLGQSDCIFTYTKPYD